ncbi:hypothetical protein [Mycobacteroides abscessus]|uniref:hypothetical protein n=1 Tax=Mycobacteroides abscessus TaxID=36809 RepID=UPI002103ADF5|nr:hypothetical protein [Mycobacteroides abscessus]
MTARDVAVRLPNLDVLQQRCRSVAMLDAILCPEWDNRRYSYTQDWGGGLSTAEIRNGSGDDCFIVFTPQGGFIRGFDHESPMSPWRASPPTLWPGLTDGLPEVFAEFLTEPAFALDGTFAATYCLWRQQHDPTWQTGPVTYPEHRSGVSTDGADQFLNEVLTNPNSLPYQRFARDYFEMQPAPAAVEHVFALRPLTEPVVRALNPGIGLDDIADDIDNIGYPV